MVDKSVDPDDWKLGLLARTDTNFSLGDEGASEEEMLKEFGSVLAEKPMSHFRQLLSEDEHGHKLEEFIRQEYKGDPGNVPMLSEEVIQWLQRVRNLISA